MSDLVYVIGVAGMFLLLIAPHEAGHFALAKLCGVRVIEFSIGAGTRIWSFTRGGTLYALRAFPILGYVRMGGMEAGDFGAPNGFHSKPAVQRILILVAGPAANFLVAMVIITGLQLSDLNSVPGKIAAVVPGSPAASVGFQPGDRILSVQGRPMTASEQLRKIEDAAPGATLVIGGVHRDGRHFEYVLNPVCDAKEYCVSGLRVMAIVTWQSAIVTGVTFPIVVVQEIASGLDMLITGQIPGGLFGKNGLTGPVGIADLTVQSVADGPTMYLLIVAGLSVALGFTNLLPLLALDGGRIMVVLLEVLRRRPFDRAAELNLQRWGIAALMALAVVITIIDIQRIATGNFAGLH